MADPEIRRDEELNLLFNPLMTKDTSSFSQRLIQDMIWHPNIPEDKRGLVKLYLSMRKVFHGPVFSYLFSQVNRFDKVVVLPGCLYVCSVLNNPANVKQFNVTVNYESSTLPLLNYMIFCMKIVLDMHAFNLIDIDEEKELLEIVQDKEVMKTVTTILNFQEIEKMRKQTGFNIIPSQFLGYTCDAAGGADD